MEDKTMKVKHYNSLFEEWFGKNEAWFVEERVEMLRQKYTNVKISRRTKGLFKKDEFIVITVYVEDH